MKRSTLDCTIIILSYNSRAVTDLCLKKLEKAVAYSEKKLGNNVTVMVVENGSRDGSAAMIKSKYPWVQLIALKENIGYTRGNNLAMKKVKTPYILLMNSDTYVKNNSLYKTLIRMSQNDCDILVSRYTQADRIFRKYGGYLPTPTKIILWMLGLESVPVIKHMLQKIYSMNADFYGKEGKLEWCPLVFTLIKKGVFEKTKGFDENMWFHMVDVEWFYRMKQQHFVTRFTPTVEVIHLSGASSKGIEHHLLQDNFQGLMYFCRKHYPKNFHRIAFFVRLGVRLRALFYQLMKKQELGATYITISRASYI